MHRTSEKISFVHPKENTGVLLPARLDQLIEDQTKTWKLLADGRTSLQGTKICRIECDGYSVLLQFNPGRIVSTSARVDEQALRARKCFLCIDNLPDEQRAILYQDEFLILCNPAPIFERHFTISHVEHREQSIEAFAGIFLDLAQELGPALMVFYNGPKCGASAPDHAHFQACPTSVIPVELDAIVGERRRLRSREKNVSLWTLNNYGRAVVVLESGSKPDMVSALHHLLDSMRKVEGVTDEPLVNILCSCTNGMWRMILFLRSKHRPDAYFREGKDRVLISPAAVDMGGLIITPLEKDFVSTDARLVEQIFREVSLNTKTVDHILESL